MNKVSQVLHTAHCCQADAYNTYGLPMKLVDTNTTVQSFHRIISPLGWIEVQELRNVSWITNPSGPYLDSFRYS